MNRSLCRFLQIFFLVVAVDQVTKAWVMLFHPDQVSIIPHFFSVTFTTNTGSIWGIGCHYTPFFAYAGIVVGMVFVLFFQQWIQRYPVGSGALLGGIMSNTLDRLIRGYVVDFLDFYIQAWHWPCFNIADLAITTTCCWWILCKK